MAIDQLHGSRYCEIATTSSMIASGLLIQRRQPLFLSLENDIYRVALFSLEVEFLKNDIFSLTYFEVCNILDKISILVGA